MTKPVSVTIKETKEKIFAVLNEANLHLSVLDMITSEVYRSVHMQAENLAKQEEAKYREDLEKEKKTKKNKPQEPLN